MQELKDLDCWDLIGTHITFLPGDSKILEIFNKLNGIFFGKKKICKQIRDLLSEVYEPVKTDHELMTIFYEKTIEVLCNVPYPKVKRFWKKNFGNVFDVSCGEVLQSLYEKFGVDLDSGNLVRILREKGFVSQRQLRAQSYKNIRVSRIALNECWKSIWRIYAPQVNVEHIEACVDLQADVVSIRFGPNSSMSVKPFVQCYPRLYPVFSEYDTSHALCTFIFARCLGLDVDFRPFGRNYWDSIVQSNSYQTLVNIAKDNYIAFFISPFFVRDRFAMTLWAIAAVLKTKFVFVVIDQNVFDVDGAIEELSKFDVEDRMGMSFDAILNDSSNDFCNLFNTCRMFHSTIMKRFSILGSKTTEVVFERAQKIFDTLDLPVQQNGGYIARISLDKQMQLESSTSSGLNFRLKVNLEWDVVDAGIVERLGAWILKRSGSRCWVNYAKPGCIEICVSHKIHKSLAHLLVDEIKHNSPLGVSIDVLFGNEDKFDAVPFKNLFSCLSNNFIGLSPKQLSSHTSKNAFTPKRKRSHILEGLSTFYLCPALFFASLLNMLKEGFEIWSFLYDSIQKDLRIEMAVSKNSYERLIEYVEAVSFEQRSLAKNALLVFLENSFSCVEKLKEFALHLCDEKFQARILEAVTQAEWINEQKISHWEMTFPLQQKDLNSKTPQVLLQTYHLKLES
jgi:hypothetical protein